MTNPTKLKDMTVEERAVLFEADFQGERIEGRTDNWPDWDVWLGAVMAHNSYYRRAPTKPSIDWSHVGPEFNHVVLTAFKSWVLTSTEPVKDVTMMCGWRIEGTTINASHFSSFRAGTCDRKDSRVSRPKEGE